MRENTITHWFLKGKLASKSMGVLWLSLSLYIVIAAFAFARDFAVVGLTFKGIVAYSVGVFSFDDMPKNNSVGQSVATFLEKSMPLKESFCASKTLESSRIFKVSPITSKSRNLKIIAPLAPELSQHLPSFLSLSDQNVFSHVLEDTDDTSVIQRFRAPTLPSLRLVQSNTFSHEPQQLKESSLQAQKSAVIQGSVGLTPLLIVTPQIASTPTQKVPVIFGPQVTSFIQEPIHQLVVVQMTPALTPVSQTPVVTINSQQVLSVVSTVPAPPPLPVRLVRSSVFQMQMSHGKVLQQRMTQVQRDLEQKLEQERQNEQKQRQLEEAFRLTAEAKRQEIEQRKNAGQIKAQLRAAAKLAAVEILEISEIFVPELPAIPLRAVNFVPESLQTLLVAKKNKLDQKRAAILEAERLRKIKSPIEEVITEDSIKVFRVSKNSVAAELLREGINPDTGKPLTGNEKIEYIDDLELSRSLSSLLSEDVDQPSSLQEAFDTSLIKKLISFYEYLLAAYDDWEASENENLRDIAKTVRSEELELNKLSDWLEEFKVKFDAEEKKSEGDIGRVSFALQRNQEERVEKLLMIKNVLLKMAKPYKKWIEALNNRIEKVSKEKELLEQQLENNCNSSLKNWEDEKKRYEELIKKRRDALEMERGKAEERYNESRSNMQKLMQYCLESALKNQGLPVNIEQTRESASKFVESFATVSDERVEQILFNIEEAVSEEIWKNVNEPLTSEIDVFREASRVMKGLNSSIEKDVEMQELQRKHGVAKTQLEGLDSEIEEIRGKIYELESELIEANETLEGTKKNHDAFKNWVISLEEVDEGTFLDSIEDAKEGLCRMKENLRSNGCDITEFEEVHKDLQKLVENLEEKISEALELDKRHEKVKNERKALQEKISNTYDEYESKKKEHELNKQKFLKIKKNKESMLKEALKIYKELSEDIQKLKDYLISPTSIKEYAEFTQKFLCKFTPKSPFAFLAQSWQEFQGTSEGTMRKEGFSFDFEKILPQKGNRIPFRMGETPEELSESF